MCLQDATGLVARCFQRPFARHPAAIFIASFGNFLPSSAALSSLISVTLGSPSPFWPFQTLPLSFLPYPCLPPTLWTLVFSVDDSFWSFRFFHSFTSRLQGALGTPRLTGVKWNSLFALSFLTQPRLTPLAEEIHSGPFIKPIIDIENIGTILDFSSSLVSPELMITKLCYIYILRISEHHALLFNFIALA